MKQSLYNFLETIYKATTFPALISVLNKYYIQAVMRETICLLTMKKMF